jgi:hypothetical protein
MPVHGARVYRVSKNSPLTIQRWNYLLANVRPSVKEPACCALPTPDFEPDDKATMQRTGTYDPSIGEEPTRAGRWGEASRIAREAIEELIGAQSEYEDWRDTMAGGSTADLLDAICNLELDEALGILEEADEMGLPKGFGRD